VIPEGLVGLARKKFCGEANFYLPSIIEDSKKKSTLGFNISFVGRNFSLPANFFANLRNSFKELQLELLIIIESLSSEKNSLGKLLIRSNYKEIALNLDEETESYCFLDNSRLKYSIHSLTINFSQIFPSTNFLLSYESLSSNPLGKKYKMFGISSLKLKSACDNPGDDIEKCICDEGFYLSKLKKNTYDEDIQYEGLICLPCPLKCKSCKNESSCEENEEYTEKGKINFINQ
jgi:hypothetical protein